MTKNDKLRYQAFCLFHDGDIMSGKQIMDENHLDYLEISPNDKWNWLHQLLMSVSPTPKTPTNVIQFFIDKGIPINAQDIYGMTPLHYAMRSHNADAAIALLEAGADPNIPNIDNVIPLAMIGLMPERLDVLELMLKKGGDVHFYNGHYEVIQSLEFWADDEAYIPVIEMMKKYA